MHLIPENEQPAETLAVVTQSCELVKIRPPRKPRMVPTSSPPIPNRPAKDRIISNVARAALFLGHRAIAAEETKIPIPLTIPKAAIQIIVDDDTPMPKNQSSVGLR